MNKALDSTTKNWHINGLKAFDMNDSLEDHRNNRRKIF